MWFHILSLLKYEHPKSVSKSPHWTWTSLLSCHFPPLFCWFRWAWRTLKWVMEPLRSSSLQRNCMGPWCWASDGPHRWQSTDLWHTSWGWNEPMSLWRTTSIQRYGSQFYLQFDGDISRWLGSWFHHVDGIMVCRFTLRFPQWFPTFCRQMAQIPHRWDHHCWIQTGDARVH